MNEEQNPYPIFLKTINILKWIGYVGGGLCGLLLIMGAILIHREEHSVLLTRLLLISACGATVSFFACVILDAVYKYKTRNSNKY